MKRFGAKLLVLTLCAWATQPARAFDYFYTPTFNQIPKLMIGEPQFDVSRFAAGGFPIRSFQGKANAILTAVPDMQSARPLTPSRSAKTGFYAFAVVNDTNVSSERATGVNFHRQLNRQRRFKPFCRRRTWFPTVRKTLD